MGAGAFDLDAYLARIGLEARPAPAELHRAHAVTIPFENIDPQRGVPVSLEPGALMAKLVHARRGGYCFEQNLLLAAALEALGHPATLMLGRVRLGRPRESPRPRTHLALGVRHDGQEWLFDVGFGNGSLLEPIPLHPGEVHEQAGWRFRIIADGPEHVLQDQRPEGWTDLYGFIPEPVPLVDLETSNWFTATYPRSPFVTGLIVAALDHAGTRLELSDWTGLALTERTPSGESVSAVAREEIPEILAGRFGLPGFALDGRGRVVPV